jgi:hypothetical protein
MELRKHDAPVAPRNPILGHPGGFLMGKWVFLRDFDIKMLFFLRDFDRKMGDFGCFYIENGCF